MDTVPTQSSGEPEAATIAETTIAKEAKNAVHSLLRLLCRYFLIFYVEFFPSSARGP